MSTQKDINLILRKYPNLDLALKKARDGKSPLKFQERAGLAIDGYYKEWSGSKDFEEAFDFAFNGWKQGLEELKTRVKKYKDSFVDLLPKQDFADEMTFSLEGEAVDIGRALEEIPESMIQFQPSEKSLIKVGNKMQRIVIQGTASAFINPKVIFNRGALIVEMIEALELHGFRTELIYRNDVKGESGRNYRVEIVVKQFDESPDYSKIAFVFGHPSMLRRIIFCLQDQENMSIIDDFNFKGGGGYGVPLETDKEDIGPNDMYFGRATQNYDLKTLVKIIREKIAIHFNVILIQEDEEDEKDIKKI